MAHAERRKRVDYCADYRRRSSYGPGLAHALYAKRVDRRRRLRAFEFHSGHVRGFRHGVIHKRACDDLTLFVVHDFFVERLPNRLHDAAMHLSFDHHRVYHLAAIIYGDVAQEFHVSRLAVYLYDRDVSAEGEGEIRRLEEMRCRKPRLHAGRNLSGKMGCERAAQWLGKSALRAIPAVGTVVGFGMNTMLTRRVGSAAHLALRERAQAASSMPPPGVKR